MRPALEGHGVTVVAISKDTVPQAGAHRLRDGLSITLLSDPDLSVIRRYGLVHRAGLEFFTFYVAGIPLGWPTGFRQMAIPTTLLVDETGVVRWVDQATDYRLRGDEARVLAAVRAAFPTGAPPPTSPSPDSPP